MCLWYYKLTSNKSNSLGIAMDSFSKKKYMKVLMKVDKLLKEEILMVRVVCGGSGARISRTDLTVSDAIFSVYGRCELAWGYIFSTPHS